MSIRTWLRIAELGFRTLALQAAVTMPADRERRFIAR